MKIKARHDSHHLEIQGLIIDNCCQWRALLHSIFGPIPVKLDLFHGVKRVTSTVSKKHQYFHVFRTDFRMVFRNAMDRLPRRTMTTPPPSEIIENLENFKARWQVMPGTPMVNKSTLDSLDNLEQHIKLGCLSGIPPGIGSNINENIHKNLKKKYFDQSQRFISCHGVLRTFHIQLEPNHTWGRATYTNRNEDTVELCHNRIIWCVYLHESHRYSA
jgi:hypothetical protein